MKTVTGLFDNYDDASDAVGELEATGIPHSDISRFRRKLSVNADDGMNALRFPGVAHVQRPPF